MIFQTKANGLCKKTKATALFLCIAMLMGMLFVSGISVTAAQKPIITVDNFDVSITEADNITAMRYASGVHTSASSIKNAADRVDISAAVIAANSVDGVYHRHMPAFGYYTFWFRMSDNTEYLVEADVTNITASVSSNGVMITIHNIGDIKDIFIAEGEYNTYTELKADYIVRLTTTKIAGKHDYTYTVTNPGMHTVLVRYNDGTQMFFHEELKVTEPTFTENGLQVTVGNIPDVKVIRTAYGEWNTPGEVKRAAGARNYSNKAVIKNAESYMLQYREEGLVTIVVEYNNGYVKVHHYDVQKKVPTVENINGGVKFGNLDDLTMIRYAKGEYTTSNQIKKAPGSVALKPDLIADGYITVSGLTVGETYTFCVQYKDDSYNYYTITIAEAEVDEPDEPVITAPTFVVDSVKAAAGNSVNVKVAVANNPGLASIGMHVEFNDALTLNSVTYNTDIGGMSYQPEELESPVKLVWVSPYADVAGDFTFVTLNFTVSATAAAGEYPIYVSYNADDVYDMTESNIAFDVINGGITVVE